MGRPMEVDRFRRPTPSSLAGGVKQHQRALWQLGRPCPARSKPPLHTVTPQVRALAGRAQQAVLCNLRGAAAACIARRGPPGTAAAAPLGAHSPARRSSSQSSTPPPTLCSPSIGKQPCRKARLRCWRGRWRRPARTGMTPPSSSPSSPRQECRLLRLFAHNRSGLFGWTGVVCAWAAADVAGTPQQEGLAWLLCSA